MVWSGKLVQPGIFSREQAVNNEDQLPPGEARAKGRSVAQVLASDSLAAPPPLQQQCFDFLGDADIDARRYTSERYAQAEAERLWPRVWQWACREEHIPEPGDHYLHEFVSQSVIIVRTDSGQIKAFINSCTHRGTKILSTEGVGYSNGFTCPFHGWSWSLDGVLEAVPGRWDFPHVSAASHSLREVRCETWGGFIFVNMDSDAQPLSHYLGVMQEHFQHFPLQRRRITVHVEKVLPANWKASQEAFMEAYHNITTHNSPHGANAQYDIFDKYVSRFIHNIGCYSPDALDDYPGDKWRSPAMTESEQLRAMGVTAGQEAVELEPGETARSRAAQLLRASLGEALDVDLSACSDSLLLDSIEYHLFPNMFFFPGISIPMVYRFRPHPQDVDRCIFTLLVLEPLADGADHPEPPEPVHLEVEDSYTQVEDLKWLGPVYDEDTGNLAMQQQGLRASGKAGITLGNYQEARIRQVHLTLDEFLGKQVFDVEK
jgi:phenylpropionate dioxygenase-like ring-hydroxylating dioxygenase large terminal subunit